RELVTKTSPLQATSHSIGTQVAQARGRVFEPAGLAVGGPSRQLDLGGLDDEFVLAFGRLGELDLLDAPAVMQQRAAERRLAGDVAGQANGRRIEAGRD